MQRSSFLFYFNFQFKHLMVRLIIELNEEITYASNLRQDFGKFISCACHSCTQMLDISFSRYLVVYDDLTSSNGSCRQNV